MNYQTLGLAYRAGFIAIGQDNVRKLMKKGKVRAVLVADSVSESTKRNLRAKCLTNNAKFVIIEDDDGNLSKHLGKNKVQVIGILSKDFKELILNERKK